MKFLTKIIFIGVILIITATRTESTNNKLLTIAEKDSLSFPLLSLDKEALDINEKEVLHLVEQSKKDIEEIKRYLELRDSLNREEYYAY